MQNSQKQTAGIKNVLASSVTPLEIIRTYESEIARGIKKEKLTYSPRRYAFAKGTYRKELEYFAKQNIDDTAFEHFKKIVFNYRKTTKRASNPFDIYENFKDMVVNHNQNVWLSKGLFKNETNILKNRTEKGIRMAYIQYWTHQMTYVHNKNIIQKAYDLYKKHSDEDKHFVVKWSDIYGLQQVETDGVTEVKMAPVDLSAFDQMIELTPTMMLRADESIYTTVKVPSKKMQEIFGDKDVRTLKHYKNLNTLFLANIVHAMIKSKWSQSTLDMILQYLTDNGSTGVSNIIDIINSMIDDGDFDQTWHYEEKISENGVNLEEARFLQLFNDMLASELPDDDDEPTEEQKQDDSKLGYEAGLKYILS